MNRPTSIVIVSLVFAVFADSGWPAALSVSELQISSGAISERMGDFEEAKAHYQKAIDLDPSAQNLLRLGLLAEQMGDLPLAVRSLTRSLSTPGKHTPAAQVLFRLYIESKNDQAALKLAEQFRWTGGTDYCQVGNRKLNTETLAFLAMLIHPERAPCLLTIAKNLTEDGLPTLARLILLTLIEKSDDAALQQEATAYLRHRLPMHDVVKLAESLNIAGYNLQHTFRAPALARAVYERAIAIDPKFSWPYHNIGLTYRDEPDVERFHAWCGKAIAVNPNHWKAQFWFGTAAYRMKRWDEALAAYRKSVELNPGDPGGYSGIGMTLMNLGQRADAIPAFQEAVRLDPTREVDQRVLKGLLEERRGG